MGYGTGQTRRRIAPGAPWGALLAVLGLLPAGSAWAAHFAHPAVDFHEPVHLSRTYGQGQAVEIRTAYVQQPRSDGDRRGFLALKLKSDLGEHLPEVRAELDYGAFDADGSVALDDARHRALWVGASSSWRQFFYGISFQSMGRDFVAMSPTRAVIDPGRDRTEVWASRRLGNLGVRAFARHARDQALEAGPATRFADTALGTGFDYRFDALPDVHAALTYTRQTRRPLAHDDPAGELNHNLAGSLSIHRDHWRATLSSLYTRKPDAATAEGGAWDEWTRSVAVSYELRPTLSVAPGLSYRSAPEAGSVHRTRSQTASLALHYQPAHPALQWSANGAWSVDRNASWGSERATFSANAAMQLPLLWRGQDSDTGALALRLGYWETVDAGARSDDLQVNLELSLHRFN